MASPSPPVTRTRALEPYRVDIGFGDGAARQIDLEPALLGFVYGPVRDPRVFARLKIYQSGRGISWPNGAVLTADTLYHWETEGPALAGRLRSRERRYRIVRAFQNWMVLAVLLIFAFSLATLAGWTGYDAYRPQASAWLTGALLAGSIAPVAGRRSVKWSIAWSLASIAGLGGSIASMAAGR